MSLTDLRPDAERDETEVPHYTAVGIGAGPANLSLAALFTAAGPYRIALFERQPGPAWHPRLLHPGVSMQTSWMKDLVSVVDPQHRLTFMKYLVSTGRLYNLLNAQFDTIPRLEYVRYLQWAGERIEHVHWGVPIDRVSYDGARGFTVHSAEPTGRPRGPPGARPGQRTVRPGRPRRPADRSGLRTGRPGGPGRGHDGAVGTGGRRRRRPDRRRVRAGAAGPRVHRHPLVRPAAVVPADGRLAGGERLLPPGVPAVPAGPGPGAPGGG